MAKKTIQGYGGYIGHMSERTEDFIEEIKKAKKIYVGNIHDPEIQTKLTQDTAFDEIKEQLKKKGQSEEEASEGAGKILSASKSKSKQKGTEKKEKFDPSTLQIMTSNGKYRELDPGELDIIINNILERESWYAERVKRSPLKSKEEFFEHLKEKKEFHYGSDWYDIIRIKPQPISEKQKELLYLRHQLEEINAKILESEEGLATTKQIKEKEEIKKKIKELEGKEEKEINETLKKELIQYKNTDEIYDRMRDIARSIKNPSPRLELIKQKEPELLKLTERELSFFFDEKGKLKSESGYPSYIYNIKPEFEKIIKK